MGDLVPGDVLFDERGGTTKVVNAYPINHTPVSYRITFDDGSVVDACKDHKWLTFDAKELAQLTRLDPEWRTKRRERRKSNVSGNKSEKFTASLIARNKAKALELACKEPPTGTVRTTQEIFETQRVHGRQRANHAVPVAKCIDLPAKEYLLDPYLLGVWLGDGTTLAGTVTKGDDEVFQAFKDAGFEVADWTEKNRYTRRIYELQPILRQLGVYGNKHVPPEYLRGSREQRLALLAGLLDTDGTVKNTSGHPQFDNTNKAIIDAVYELIVSLGWKASVTEKRAKLYGKDCGPTWRISFAPDEYVFRLPRKRNLQKLATRRTNKFRYIVNVEPIEPKPMRCISVDNPTRLFLCGRSFIPTHNSLLIIGLSLTRHRKSLILRREGTQLKEIIAQLREYAPAGSKWKYEGSGGTLRTPDGRIVECAGVPHEDDKHKFQGRDHDLKALDECTEFTESIYDFVSGWKRTLPGQNTLQLLTGNPPTHIDGQWVIRRFAPWVDPFHANRAVSGEIRWFAKLDDGEQEVPNGDPIRWEKRGEVYYIKPRSRTFVFASAKDNPIYAQTDYISHLASLPDALRDALLFGDFTISMRDDAWQVIPMAWIKAAMDRWTSNGNINPMTSAGGDIAYGGADKTAFAPKHGNWIGNVMTWHGVDTDSGKKAANWIRPLVPNTKTLLNVDGIGWGAAAKESLQETHSNVVHVGFGEGAGDLMDKRGTVRFHKLRDYAYWRLRDALDPELGERIALPPDKDLMAELASVRYSSLTGKIKVESKDDIKKRLGRSPDKADAVALAVFEMPVRKAMAMFV